MRLLTSLTVLGLIVVSCSSVPEPEEFTYEFKMPEFEPINAVFSDSGGWLVNRLRGYALWMFPDFQTTSLQNGFYVVDNKERLFGRITFVRVDADSLKLIWQDLVEKLRPYVKGEVYFKETQHKFGKTYHWLITESRFPRELFNNLRKSGTFQTHIILKEGDRWHRVEIITYNLRTDSADRARIFKAVQSFKILPQDERIPYEVQGVPSGVEAYLVPVPEGFQASGYIFPMDALQEAHWKVESMDDPNIFIRRDVVYISAAYTMGFPMYVATMNGNQINYHGEIPTSRSQWLGLLNSIWGGGWQLEELWTEPVKPLKRDIEMQLNATIQQGYGVFPTEKHATAFIALFKRGNLYRYAILTAGSMILSGWGVGSAFAYGSLVTLQMPEDKHKEMSHLLFSLSFDVIANPDWVSAVRRRNQQIQTAIGQWTRQRLEAIKQEGAMFRQYLLSRQAEAEAFNEALYSHQEFVSDINEAWGNILGENIYAQDPSTGEIFYLDDLGGTYLRNPETGTILMGVDPYSADHLQSLGWQPMNLSYEPFD